MQTAPSVIATMLVWADERPIDLEFIRDHFGLFSKPTLGELVAYDPSLMPYDLAMFTDNFIVNVNTHLNESKRNVRWVNQKLAEKLATRGLHLPNYELCFVNRPPYNGRREWALGKFTQLASSLTSKFDADVLLVEGTDVELAQNSLKYASPAVARKLCG